jgi:hypothetical protein
MSESTAAAGIRVGEAASNGAFVPYYSGKTGRKSQYTLTCEVLAIEEVSASVKLGAVFP